MSAGFLACNDCGHMGRDRADKRCPSCGSRNVDQDDDCLFDSYDDCDEEEEE